MYLVLLMNSAGLSVVDSALRVGRGIPETAIEIGWVRPLCLLLANHPTRALASSERVRKQTTECFYFGANCRQKDVSPRIKRQRLLVANRIRPG